MSKKKEQAGRHWSAHEGHELCTYNSILPELQDLNPPEPVTLGELLAEYDLRVLKRWVEDQNEQEAAQEVPEKRK